jgi:hypothetical protein
MIQKLCLSKQRDRERERERDQERSMNRCFFVFFYGKVVDFEKNTDNSNTGQWLDY